ncbi:MAG: alpha/beta hydrolase [Taibaiella sp.]|nr:alpha/beta hydrolase [Taibaiella sp.]
MSLFTDYPGTYHKITLPCSSTVAYTDEGSGNTTLLFIHGLANYSLSWRKNTEELKKSYRCIAIDLPGNGFSDHTDRPYTMSFFANVIYELIIALQLKNVCLVGHSMGGQIAITTVLNHPGVVKALVLCAPSGFETFSSFEKTMYQASVQFFNMFASDEQSLRQTIENSFYHYPRQADEMIDDLLLLMKEYPSQLYRKMVEGSITGMLNEPVFSSLGKINIPTLVIFGEKDALIPNTLLHPGSPRKLATDTTKLIPGAKLKMVPDCGHFVQWEKAGEVNKYIQQFAG